MLTFDEGTHTYRWEGNLVPGVTSVIGGAGLTDYSSIPPAVLDRARQEGVAMHRMVEYEFAGDLDESTLPEWLKPRLAAWRKFRAESGFEPDASERQVYHPIYKYAGTYDLSGRAKHMKQCPGRGLIDLKRSFTAGPAIGLQLAAYMSAENYVRGVAKLELLMWRAALKLNADGSYNLKQYNDKEDFDTFLSCLKIQRWREKHGK